MLILEHFQFAHVIVTIVFRASMLWNVAPVNEANEGEDHGSSLTKVYCKKNSSNNFFIVIKFIADCPS